MLRRAAFALLTAVALLSLAPVAASASDILANGNFDADPFATGWIQDDGGSGYPPIVHGYELPLGITPHSAPNAVWLGGLFDVTESVSQDIAVPAGVTSLKLTGYLWIYTEELGGQFDHLYAEIIAPGGTEVLRHWTNLDANGGWTAFTLVAGGSYAGQTVRLRFRSTCDATLNTNFLLDTCALEAMPTVDVPRSPTAISRLYAARPNPTRAGVRLRLDLAAPTTVRANIYDLSGRWVRRIADRTLEAGSHDLGWDGTDAAGGRVASGVYICRVDAGGHVSSRTLALVH
jgi:flagellar hook capping protein FlgD